MNKMVLAHFQGLTPPDLIHDHIILSGFTIAVLGLAAWCIFTQAFLTDLPVIRGIPEAPGAVAFYGHLKVLGLDHPSQFEKWGTKRSWPVLQARFGRRRVVVLNGFKEAQEWIVKNATATIDRPLFWTFHNVVSKSQG